MARPLRIQYPGACYHVICRGSERKKIVRNAHDEKLFLEKLSLSLEIYNVSLLAYACMSNHFQILITTPEGNISEFMHHFNISYTSVFNRRHRSSGHLFQGRFKSFLIDADNYLLDVSRYIHLSPIRIRGFSKKRVNEKWDELLKFSASSLLGYFWARKRSDIVEYGTILDYMGGDNRKGREKYRRFIELGIKQEIENPLELGKGHGIVGGPDFIQYIKEKFLTKKPAKRKQPALKKKVKPQKFINHFSHLTGKTKKDICLRGKRFLERAMLMELLYRFCHISQPEIGRLLGGIHYSAVSQARKRLQIRLTQEPKVKKRFDELTDQLLPLSKE